MKKLNEKELTMANGGMNNGGMLGGARFNEGDKVTSKANPDFGVGTVTGMKYCRGWHYYVASDNGGKLYAPESDLQPVLFQ